MNIIDFAKQQGQVANQILDMADQIESLKRELREARQGPLKDIRSEDLRTQGNAGALLMIWVKLGVSNQTECMQKLDQLLAPRGMSIHAHNLANDVKGVADRLKINEVSPTGGDYNELYCAVAHFFQRAYGVNLREYLL